MTTARLAERLKSCGLYLITPSRPAAGELDEFLPLVLEAGVDMVQLREKDLEAGLLMPFCEIVRRRTSEFGALFIVNDRVDVALAAGADGVHLGQDDLGAGHAREQMGGDQLIGVSTHADSEVAASSKLPVDYVAVGPIYQTPTKPGRAATGLDLIKFARDHCRRPFFAIGGIDLTTLPDVIEAGADRVCVLRALTQAEDPGAVARRIKSFLI